MRGNLTGWIVTNVTSSEIYIDLKFDQPLYVSLGDKPDQLLVQLNLDCFTDIDGEQLLPGLIKINDLPPQISSNESLTI